MDNTLDISFLCPVTPRAIQNLPRTVLLFDLRPEVDSALRDAYPAYFWLRPLMQNGAAEFIARTVAFWREIAASDKTDGHVAILADLEEDAVRAVTELVEDKYD